MKALQRAIEAVNARYAKGLNDDDQVAKMVEIDKTTKGYTFRPTYDGYEMVTDEQKLIYLVDRYGYWSNEVLRFNETLKLKGGKNGYQYMESLNNKIKR